MQIASRIDTATTDAPDGFYAGRILIAGIAYALIQPPKAIAEHAPTIWIPRNKSVIEALTYNDGLANTEAMARSGSKLAQWALDLGMYIPSVDEEEIIYRAFKPGTAPNSLWARSGINVSAIPPTYPYTADSPQQTTNELFRTGGAEAFAEESYWTSTQHAVDSDNACYQYFGNGYQNNWLKYRKLRARAVRRLKI